MDRSAEKDMTRRVRSQISKRCIDTTRLDIHVVNGVVYLRGSVGRLRTHMDVHLDTECETITRILRQQPGIRDVIWETSIR